VCLTEIHTVIESRPTAPIVVDEGFASETGELDNHTSENTISENLSVVDHSVDIPDVIIVGVDISMNNESETGEFDHHTSDNIISENASVVSMSVDIPDVINVEVDIPTNNTRGELPKFTTSLKYKQEDLQLSVISVHSNLFMWKSSKNIFGFMIIYMTFIGIPLLVAVSESCLKSLLKRP